MKIVELKKRKLPYGNSVIYPDLSLVFGVLSGISDPTDVRDPYNKDSYMCNLKTLVEIERDGFKYLVPYVKHHEGVGLFNFMESFSNFISSVNVDCHKIIEEFIIDKSISDDIEPVIYKLLKDEK